MTRLAGDGILGFSSVPLRLALRAGYLVSLLSIAFGLSAVGANLAGLSIPGWTSLVVATTFIGGLQLILIGIVGEYVGRIYDEVRNRPLYFVRDLHGFDGERQPGERLSASRANGE